MVGFDVVIPVFKTEPKHLREAIDSVLKQTYQDFEIYISDGTPEEHEWHSSQTLKDYDDDRIHILQQEGRGISDARNQALEAGFNSYIALLDSDDTWYNLKLEDYAEKIQNNTDLKFMWGAADIPIELVSVKGELYSTTQLGGYHNDWAKTHPTHRWFRIFWTPLMTSTHVYSRYAVETVGGWNVNHTMGEDTELNCKIAKRWPQDCLQLDAIYGTYRVHENQTTQKGESHKEESGIVPLARTIDFELMFEALKSLDCGNNSEDYWEWLKSTLHAERGFVGNERAIYSLRDGTRTIIGE